MCQTPPMQITPTPRMLAARELAEIATDIAVARQRRGSGLNRLDDEADKCLDLAKALLEGAWERTATVQNGLMAEDE